VRVNPRAIDITVGRGRRIARRGGEGYELHREDVAAADRAWREGVPVVRLRKAVEQCIIAGTPTYLLEQAVENGLAQGFLTAAEARGLNGKLEARRVA
jgi:predicted transcriptional regulator of viral defense system